MTVGDLAIFILTFAFGGAIGFFAMNHYLKKDGKP